MSYGIFKTNTSEVEVKMEAEVKSRSDLNREWVDLLPQKNWGPSFKNEY